MGSISIGILFTCLNSGEYRTSLRPTIFSIRNFIIREKVLENVFQIRFIIVGGFDGFR